MLILSFYQKVFKAYAFFKTRIILAFFTVHLIDDNRHVSLFGVLTAKIIYIISAFNIILSHKENII